MYRYMYFIVKWFILIFGRNFQAKVHNCTSYNKESPNEALGFKSTKNYGSCEYLCRNAQLKFYWQFPSIFKKAHTKACKPRGNVSKPQNLERIILIYVCWRSKHLLAWKVIMAKKSFSCEVCVRAPNPASSVWVIDCKSKERITERNLKISWVLQPPDLFERISKIGYYNLSL